ncbi:glycosyltransferase family 4 protein [Rubrivirga sp. S365]|uniref:glycosyltransferase family 4 protein n=1 Tax=Rubrivirga sp. S365 TaxID=3076080 RepID=UPI0028C6818C|nr:glycosyltransferase family 4 protein [Rubrivirga sp. S365]MDT7856826.1 glycosyltransferase family 4 protein [Rubrivirga sp. S365]
MKLGVLATHPIQYHAPLYRALARELDLHVYFAQRQTAQGQADAGFGVAFEWDVDLLDGYPHTFLENRAGRPSTDTFGGSDTPQIADAIRAGRFDAFLVTGWNNRSFWQAMTACWRIGTPLLVRGDSQLVTPRSWAKRIVKEVAYRAFIPRFDGYLVVGERARAYYLHYGADPARMHFVPHFVDNDFFRSGAEAADDGRPLRAELGYGADAQILLFVGKFIPKKRPVDVVRAAAALRERGGNAHVLLVGAGELEGALRAEADRAGVPTHFAGFKNQTELPAYYAAADALVLPSDGGETWGLVVNEAMACRTPAAVSNAVGCAPDLIDEGATGATYSIEGGVAALADALERLLPLAGEPATRRALDQKMETYSLDQAVRGTIEAVRAVSRPSR